MVTAPRPAAYAARRQAMGSGAGRTRAATPRFDRGGFPMDVAECAARRVRLRHRAIRTTVAVAVVAASGFALCTAYRTSSVTNDQARNGSSLSASGHGERTGALGRDPYGRARGAVSAATASSRQGGRPTVIASVADGRPADPPTSSTTPGAEGPQGPGRLSVRAQARGGDTLITLTAVGGSPASWTASTGAAWLRLSASHGTLRPGGSTVITVTVDHSAEPAGPWTARVGFQTSGAVVTIHGSGPPPPSPTLSQPPPQPPASESPSGEPEPQPSGS
jgi:hypothetical protein